MISTDQQAKTALAGKWHSSEDQANTSITRFGKHVLCSHFQPVVSLSMQRAVGYEALLRGATADDSLVFPGEIFTNLSAAERKRLDHLTHQMHLNNFQGLVDAPHWHFLNMTSEVFLEARHAKSNQSFGDLLARLNYPAHRVVIEVLEDAVEDAREIHSAVAYFRELGCLIALDDFGAGSSNFDRVWTIRPQIVKLDRSVIRQSAANARVRRTLPQLISLLHEAGAMVLIEGIETADEAYIALDANADFAQGYLFGRPAPRPADPVQISRSIDTVWQQFDRRVVEESRAQKETLTEYMNAIGNASVFLSVGRGMDEACHDFLGLERASICYLLDDQGRQIGCNLWSTQASKADDPRLAPLKETHRARWSRAPYFRRAVEHFGRVQVTRPYLSVSSARLCVTVSVSFRQNEQLQVICGDVHWP